jgi:transcriptional regulator with XRE-family HTH domain
MAQRAPCDLDKELANYLRTLMKKNEWSYSQLEDATGVKRSMLHNLVNLQRGASLSLVSRICRKMKVNLRDIFPEAIDS